MWLFVATWSCTAPSCIGTYRAFVDACLQAACDPKRRFKAVLKHDPISDLSDPPQTSVSVAAPVALPPSAYPEAAKQPPQARHSLFSWLCAAHASPVRPCLAHISYLRQPLPALQEPAYM